MKAKTISHADAKGPKFTLALRFKVKPGLKLALLEELKTILAHCACEPEFVTAILHENPEQPLEIVVFELWRGTREEFMKTQGPKDYRQDYMERSRPLIASVEVSFLSPIREWGGTRLAS